MQKMALWFIEGADGIDVNDPRWIVYIVTVMVWPSFKSKFLLLDCFPVNALPYSALQDIKLV